MTVNVPLPDTVIDTLFIRPCQHQHASTSVSFPGVWNTPSLTLTVGKWCAKPIPEFNDTYTCLKSFTACVTQLGACFAYAGYPDNLRCGDFNQYCSRIASFCGTFCPGPRCSVIGCRQVVPSYGVPTIPSVISGIVQTSVFTCDVLPHSSTIPPTSVTTITPSRQTTSQSPPPVHPNICKQPSNPSNDYGASDPVGGFPLPPLSCNNDWSSYNSGYPFKLYTSSDLSKCRSYQRSGKYGPIQGCVDACDEQYQLCFQGYANPYRTYKKFKRGERNDYYSAVNRCAIQRDDCYYVNRAIGGESRCTTFNSDY